MKIEEKIDIQEEKKINLFLKNVIRNYSKYSKIIKKVCVLCQIKKGINIYQHDLHIYIYKKVPIQYHRIWMRLDRLDGKCRFVNQAEAQKNESIRIDRILKHLFEEHNQSKIIEKALNA
jgi:hypothetical protein